MEIVTEHPIVPGAMHSLIAQKCSGSVVLHYAVVKIQQSLDKVTTGIEYQSAGDTVAELKEISAELKGKWELEDVLLVRRTGTLGIGDIISLIAVSSPNSSDAFASCQHGISRLRKMATIRKNEMYG
jgi:molybdopterin synthase catalytic subunit